MTLERSLEILLEARLLEIVSCINNVHAGKILKTLQDNFEQVILQYGAALPQGWRCIVKVCDSRGDTLSQITMRSDRGGGEHADAKLHQLEQHPEQILTSPDNFDSILSYLSQKLQGESEELAALELLENAYQIPQALKEWLLQQGITFDYGGLQVPYRCFTFLDEAGADTFVVQHGKIYIAFDGAVHEQDLFFALAALSSLKSAYRQTLINEKPELDLSNLRYHNESILWMQLLGL